MSEPRHRWKPIAIGAAILVAVALGIAGLLWLNRTDEIATMSGHAGPVRALA